MAANTVLNYLPRQSVVHKMTGTTNPFLFVCAFVGVQALIEAVGCGIVATLVTVPLLKFLKK